MSSSRDVSRFLFTSCQGSSKAKQYFFVPAAVRESLPDLEIILEQAILIPSSDSSSSKVAYVPTNSRGRFSVFGGALSRPWRNTKFAPDREHGAGLKMMMSDESLSSEGISHSPLHPHPPPPSHPHHHDGAHLSRPEPSLLHSLLKLLNIPSHHPRFHSHHSQALLNPDPELDSSSWRTHSRPAAVSDDGTNLDASLLANLLHHSPPTSIESMRSGVPRRGPPSPSHGRHPHRHHRHLPRFACRFRRFMREMKPLIMGMGWLKWMGLLVVLVGCVGRVTIPRTGRIELADEVKDVDANEKELLEKEALAEERV